MSSPFGKAKYRGESSYEIFRMQDGSNIFRILPPFKSLAEEGRWAVFLKQHFGYKGANKYEPSKPRFRTFICSQDKDRKTGMIRKSCAECDKIEEMKLALDSRTAVLKAEGRSADEIETLTGPLRMWVKDHNVDKKWVVLAMNQDGQFGVLYIPHTAKQMLDDLAKRLLEEEGIDPLDVTQGAWFNFRREGKGFNTNYTVEVVQDMVKVDGRTVKSTKLGPLSDEQLRVVAAACPDLTEMGTKLSDEQIQRLVQSSGDPEEVDAIFDAGRETTASPPERSPVPASAMRAVQNLPPPPPERKAPPPSSAPSVDQLLQEDTGDDEEAQLQRQLAELRAKKAAAKPVVATGVPTTTATRNARDMSDAEFLELLNNK